MNQPLSSLSLLVALTIAPAVTAQDTTPPLSVEAPNTVAEAAAVDPDDLLEQLADQEKPRLVQLLDGWMKLVDQQAQACLTAAAAPEGSTERDQLSALQADGAALLVATEVVIDSLAKKAGDDSEVAEILSAHRARIAEVRQASILDTETLPQDLTQAEEVPLEVLRSKLRPMTQAEVQEQLGQWLAVLQRRARAISSTEVAGMIAEDNDAIHRYTERAVVLRSNRDRLISRVEVVIDSLEEKGGDVTEATAYVDSLTVTPPVTGIQAAWSTLYAWVVNPEGGLSVGLSILYFAVILVAFRLLSRLLASLVGRALLAMHNTSELLRTFMTNIVRNVVFLIGIVVALSQLGVDIGPLIAGIGAAGLVIGFALQNTLSNFASGVMIMMYQPFERNDIVDVAGVTGKVAGLNLVSTTILTFDNQTIVVPNSMIWGNVITNVTANSTRRVDMVFGIGYDDNIARAQTLLREIVSSDPKVLETPEPTIELHELADSSVNFVVRPWAQTSDYWDVYWSVTRAVKERFDQEGISIPFPQRDVHVIAGNPPAPLTTAAPEPATTS